MTSPSPYRLALALIVTLVIWGTSFAFLRVGLQSFPPGSLALLRYLIASLALLLLAFWTRPQLPTRAELPRLLMVGAVGVTCYNLLMSYGLMTVGAGPGAFINNTIPLFSTILAIILLGERPGWVMWVGMMLCLLGVAFIAIGESAGRGIAIGALLLLGSAASYATYTVVQKPLLARHGPIWVVSWAVWIGSALLLPWAPEALQAAKGATAVACLAIGFLALFSTALGFLLWSWCLQHLAVSRLSPALYVVPVISLATAWAWLGERPAALSLCGCAVVIGGVLLSTRILARGPVIIPS